MNLRDSRGVSAGLADAVEKLLQLFGAAPEDVVALRPEGDDPSRLMIITDIGMAVVDVVYGQRVTFNSRQFQVTGSILTWAAVSLSSSVELGGMTDGGAWILAASLSAGGQDIARPKDEAGAKAFDDFTAAAHRHVVSAARVSRRGTE